MWCHYWRNIRPNSWILKWKYTRYKCTMYNVHCWNYMLCVHYSIIGTFMETSIDVIGRIIHCGWGHPLYPLLDFFLSIHIQMHKWISFILNSLLFFFFSLFRFRDKALMRARTISVMICSKLIGPLWLNWKNYSKSYNCW